MPNKRKSYADENAQDACPKCGCRHFVGATAFKNGNKVVVEMTCRNCGAKISS